MSPNGARSLGARLRCTGASTAHVGLALLIASAAVGCRDRDGAGRAAPPIAAAAPALRPRQISLVPADPLRHCPVTVDGAATAIDDVPGAVTLTVTARHPAAVAEIRRRAAHLEPSASPCPVVTFDTQVDVEEIAGGARLIVRPLDGPLADLRAEIRGRYADLP